MNSDTCRTSKTKKIGGINTPEGEERELGIVSRGELREKILDKDIILETIKDKKGKYGRFKKVNTL